MTSTPTNPIDCDNCGASAAFEIRPHSPRARWNACVACAAAPVGIGYRVSLLPVNAPSDVEANSASAIP